MIEVLARSGLGCVGPISISSSRSLSAPYLSTLPICPNLLRNAEVCATLIHAQMAGRFWMQFYI